MDGDKVIEETTAADILALSIDFTNESDSLSGASDLLINGDLSFSKQFAEDKDLMATVAFNYFSDRIYALGTEGKGNLVDKAVATLDVVFKASLNKHLSIGLNGMNLLNPNIVRSQEVQNVDVLTYKKGTNVNLSLSYNF